MTTRHFFPRPICAKCNKPCDLERKATRSGRLLFAVCHGERVAVAWQTEADVEIKVFE